MTPSELLIQAKAKFGWGMVKWTRGVLRRSGFAGENYCSMGALNSIPADWRTHEKAQRYLHEAIAPTQTIENFNDVGHARWLDGFQNSSLLIKGLIVAYVVITRYHPGSWLWRSRQVKRAWCRAIQMAVDDELKEAQNGTD